MAQNLGMSAYLEEQDRIKALNSYSILDTLEEEDYNHIVELASAICQTKISLISLVDKDRQWFKAKVGLEATETPRIYSFCSHAIQDKDNVFIIKDARQDERFKTNPLVTSDPNIVFYAGVPLVDPEGNALGSLCVIDDNIKELTESQLIALRTLSKQTINLLELRKKSSDLEAAISQLKIKTEALQSFAYAAAHDIRSPLANITTLLNLLADNVVGKIDAEDLEILDHVQNSSYQLNNYIKGLLDYNQTEFLGSAAKEQFSLIGLLYALRPTYQIGMEVKFYFNSEVEEMFSIKIAIEQILMNLFDNAVKYNNKEVCEISVKTWEDSKHYHIEVSDNGPGFPKKEGDTILDLFTTGQIEDNQGIRGSGIGLATVKKLVSILKGEIKLSNNPEGGGNFYFTISK